MTPSDNDEANPEERDMKLDLTRILTTFMLIWLASLPVAHHVGEGWAEETYDRSSPPRERTAGEEDPQLDGIDPAVGELFAHVLSNL